MWAQKIAVGIVIAATLQFCCPFATAQLSADQWRQDLQILASQLPSRDPYFFANVSRADFNDAVTQLDAQISDLAGSQIVVRLAQLVALAGDGHTSLSLTQNASRFHMYGLSLFWFKEGIYAIGAGPAGIPALGKRLIRIERTSVEDAILVIATAISHDTDQWVRFKVPTYLVIPELLSAVGIVADINRASFTFDNGDGSETTLTLTPISLNSGLSYRAPHLAAPLNPLYQRNSSFLYWANYIESSQTLYIKYNVCGEDPTLKFADFTAGVLSLVDNNPITRVVLDFRNNEGGNSATIAPLISGLHDRYARGIIPSSAPGLVIIGRETFSSGVLNAVQLKQSGYQLIGEVAGWNPNGFGEVQSFTLPNSQLVVYYSTRKFALGVPGSVLNPDIAIDVTWADYAAELDAFLAAALALPQ